MLLNDQPLGLPQGSVRAVLALGIVAAFVAGLVEIEVATLILGTYFGIRPNGE
jgi:hypothetical protein